ncbi:hypothetical protein J7I93_00385 [Bacillus sp. ISL-47]|uniref:hypothetical protein n=1 Tax=Bacillus sp. ISL-47 TaxID=2819130 RepID=UPI001BE5C65F|nr:hypothetical protein [Bacillus sp. ISL-47]MBT2686633.1 hypothetical protein [Bacillus sp. ISL-47]MBT2707025.1 hypothetical protein [Pseudomonas sp. ISL-84]
MSLVNYLGCNFKLPINAEKNDDDIQIGDFFSDKEMRDLVKKHFSTKYVFEVTSNKYGTIWFNRYYKKDCPKGHIEGQEAFLALCEFLDRYLTEEEYCELYTCWVGEESEDKEHEQTIFINNFDINEVEINEKTMLVIRKGLYKRFCSE